MRLGGGVYYQVDVQPNSPFHHYRPNATTSTPSAPSFATTAARSSPAFGLICEFGMGKERCRWASRPLLLRSGLGRGPITQMADVLSQTRSQRVGLVWFRTIKNIWVRSPVSKLTTYVSGDKEAQKKYFGVKSTKFCILNLTRGDQTREN